MGLGHRELEEFQTICLFLFFKIFYVKSMYLPVPQHRFCCQNYLGTSLISWAESHTSSFTVIINILYTRLPSEQGTWQGSTAMSATSQSLDFSFKIEGLELQTIDILLNIWFPLQGPGGRKGVAFGVCKDCFYCLCWISREAVDLMERTLTLELC